MTYPTPDPRFPSPYAGSVVPPEGAGRRDERRPEHSSAHLPGGLLALGARVQVSISTGPNAQRVVGEITDLASVPAPYITVTTDAGTPTVVFTGPGVTITAHLEHPGLG